MSTSTAAEELLATIAQRRTFLECVLQQDGSTTKQTLLSELERTRSPIEKAIRDLQEMALLDVGPNGISPTLLARLAYDRYLEYCRKIATVGDSDDLWPTVAQQQEVMSLIAVRCDVLECIWTTPHDKRDLVDTLDVSRSTVDRAVRELAVASLIEWRSDGYMTTPAGRQATAQYYTTVQTLGDILSAQDVLTALSLDCLIEPAPLVDAAVEYSVDSAPYHLPTPIRDQIVAGDRVSLCLPTLATPLLLDCCHRGVVHRETTLEILTSTDVYDSLTSEFPGPLADMAGGDACSVAVTDRIDDLPPFGLVISESETNTSISIIVYNDRDIIHGTIHNETDAAIGWATACYEQASDGVTDVTDELRTLSPVDTARETMTVSGGIESERVKWEDEGFVQLTPSYFAQRAPAAPLTGWRTGFDLVDIHAGYAIDREKEHDGTRHNLTTELTERLRENTNIAILGPPGSGKSTVCKSIACRWYEQGMGPVFYRESGRGRSFDAPMVLERHLREIDGHALVVVEDAVRAESNAIFRLIKEFRGSETVTFLLDAREGEWADPGAFPVDAGLDAIRTETIDTVSMPSLDDTEAQRFVHQFEQTIDDELDGSTEQMLQESWTDVPDKQGAMESGPASVLLLLHRLSMYADPLIAETANIPTILIEDIDRTYETLQRAGDLVLDVGVFVNLLNAAGLRVSTPLVCALADETETTGIETIRDALSVLEGRVIFERDERTETVAYRTIHEEWSVLFLDHLLDIETEQAASVRVGRCVSALLSLADEQDRRNRIMTAFRHTAPAIEHIADEPGEWADITVERLFRLGLLRPGLAPLFGTTGDSPIDLPEACSQTVTVKCTLWRALMAKRARDFDSAEHEYECLPPLADDVEATDPDWAATLRGRRFNGLGVIALRRNALDTAETYYTHALDQYHEAGNTLQAARTHLNLGLVADYRNNLETAERSYIQSLDRFREHGQPRLEGVALQNLGVVTMQAGDLDTALDYNRQALDIYHEVGNRQSSAHCLHNLGDNLAHQGILDTATSYCTEALSVYRDTGDRYGTARTFDVLGRINRMQGDFDTAEKYHDRSLDVLRELGDRKHEAECLTALGTLARHQGDLDTATAHYETSHEISQEIGDRAGRAAALVGCGALARQHGDLDTASEHANEALTLYHEIEDPLGEAVSHRELGRIACDHEQFQTAETHLTQALTDFRDMGYRYEEAETLTALGSLARARTKLKNARAWYEEALNVYRDIGAVRDTVKTLDQLARVCETQGDLRVALSHCETACDLAQDTAILECPASLDERRLRLKENRSTDRNP